MAINYVKGELLAANLLRGGVNLAVETDLLYLDVTSGFVGIKNALPTVELDITGAIKSTTAAIGDLSLASSTLSSAATITLSSTSGIVAIDDTSTEAQLVLPNHTSAEITSISGPVTGATVYDSTAQQLKFYNGTAWINAGSSASAGASTYVLTALTTDATQIEALVGASRLVLPDNTTWRFEVNVVARRTDANDEGGGYKFTGVIDRNTGVATTAIVGIVAETIDAEDNAAWFVTVDADTTNGSLRVQVNGEALKDIKWVVFVRTVEVSN